MPLVFLDTETYSEADLKKVGAYRYAQDDSTRITVLQWAVDDGPVRVADLTETALLPVDFLQLYQRKDTVFVAHNAQFDRLVLSHRRDVHIPLHRWRCTMAMALLHGYPGALGKLGAALGVPSDRAKDARGNALIHLFCKPVPRTGQRNTRETHPEQWAEFLEYSHQDIVALREVYRLLPQCNPWERFGAEWMLDQELNDRGVPIDIALAQAAVDAAERARADGKKKTRELTHGFLDSPTQRDAVLDLLRACGLPLADARAPTLQKLLDDDSLPPAARTLISLRLGAAQVTSAKYTAMLRTAGADGRVRGAIQFCGAARTGRDAGRLIQPQNFKRQTQGQDTINQWCELLQLGMEDAAGVPVPDLLGECARAAICAPEGRTLVAADLANIEGRVLAFLAGEHWKLDAFRDYDAGTGPDLYRVAYGRSFGKTPEQVTGSERQVGKVQELACGYAGWVGAFATFATVYGVDLEALATAVQRTAPLDAWARGKRSWEWAVGSDNTLDLSEAAYTACAVVAAQWRGAHPATVTFWRDLETAFALAARSPGEDFPVGDYLTLRREGALLLIRLPSGRFLCYDSPEVETDARGKSLLSYNGVLPVSYKWGRIHTHGGKLAENVTQAVARDVLKHGQTLADLIGLPVILPVHDELLAEVPEKKGDAALANLVNCMSTVPEWAAGLPLAAKGYLGKRYRKD